MFEEQNAQWGLVHAFVLDGRGGAQPVAREALADLQLTPEQSLWLHWDRSHPLARRWLREQSGLSEFTCDLLLEESTRPRMLALPGDELLLFLRGVNLNPGAVPEDMVSVRIFASAQRILSLRLRPLHATDELIAQWEQGSGPKTSSEVLLYMAEHLTDKVDSLVADLSERVDEQEEQLDNNVRFHPNHDLMLQIRRRAAGLKRFLAPQRDIYGQLARSRAPWFVGDDSDYWNELNNRLTRYLEELELIRERIGLVLESESRRQGERTSRTMYLLGITTGFFLPLSFITGLLGMNVNGIPGDETPWGFLLACLVILGIASFQLWLFRRLRWL
ncbi:zinc transporter ZntB [Metapseudomonas resinovorans]|uniref:CmaX protein n=1 Tax=Metapseudomonas resinovorans NBRC 106553 TaxID=1245471 RepID=S6AXQ2_METRE|nr:zinc transporter ZntB [Pseudomonas resinovorans]BAN49446.1 CmaX protein [Pseudomonas resinovorans NBRC 106553]